MGIEDMMAWGPPELELWYFMKQGLLNSVRDPDVVARAEEAQVAGMEEVGAEDAGGASDDVQPENGSQTDKRMIGEVGDFVVLEDSANKAGTDIYSGLVVDEPGVNDDDDADLESDGASWHLVS